MRSALLVLPIALIACAEPGPEPGADTALIAAQEAACRQAIAAHVRRPEAEVIPRWLMVADGIATVETIDGNRHHLCLVDAAGQVIDYQHPDT